MIVRLERFVIAFPIFDQLHNIVATNLSKAAIPAGVMRCAPRVFSGVGQFEFLDTLII
jgi:hypothetical protein